MKNQLRLAPKWAMEFIARPLAIAVFFVLLALLWTFPFEHVFAYPFVFLFFGAIMCSAWFGGFVAGMFAVTLSSLLVGFFFIPPLFSISIAQEYRSYVTGFIVCAIAITAVSAARRRSETAVRLSHNMLEARVEERTAELQRSNEEIRERERELRLLTEAIPQQIWRTDGNGSIEYANGDLLDYLGKDLNQLLGDRFFHIFHPDDASVIRNNWALAQATHRKFEAKARVQDAGGIFRWFIVRANPQFSETGELVRWYGVHIDIEEQENARQELLLSQERLARFSRNASMAEMAASIAHQLNQPLTAILAEAHTCRRWLGMEPPNLERAVATAEQMVRDTTRAGEVVGRVRSLFSRSDYVREPGDLNSLIRDLVRLLRDETIRQQVAVTMSLADSLPSLSLDRIQIQQVLLNLVMNAMEAMSQSTMPRELTIVTRMQSEREVLVTVKDRGTGITQETGARMFEPFFTTKPGGTGMGLAICRSIVEEHDGRIWAEPMADGTAIHFTLRTTA